MGVQTPGPGHASASESLKPHRKSGLRQLDGPYRPSGPSADAIVLSMDAARVALSSVVLHGLSTAWSRVAPWDDRHSEADRDPGEPNANQFDLDLGAAQPPRLRRAC